MGSCCCRPEFSSTEEITRARHLDGAGGPPDYPRPANDFYAIGAPDFAIFCWLAADKPLLAERVYERSGFYLVDNQFGARIPVWRMIVGARMGDIRIFEEARAAYFSIMGATPTWVEHALMRVTG